MLFSGREIREAQGEKGCRTNGSFNNTDGENWEEKKKKHRERAEYLSVPTIELLVCHVEQLLVFLTSKRSKEM